jgi:hypothetical protein
VSLAYVMRFLFCNGVRPLRELLFLLTLILSALLGTEIFTAAADSSSDLQKQIDTLTAALSTGSVNDDKVRASLNTLLEKIGKINCDSLNKTTDCKIAALKSFTNGWKKNIDENKIAEFSAQQGSDLWLSLNSILLIPTKESDFVVTKPMEFVTSVQSSPKFSIRDIFGFASAFSNLTSATVKAIQDSKPAETLPKTKIDSLIKVVQDTYQKFGQLLISLGPQDRRINVVGAWFGDLDRIYDRISGSPESLKPWRSGFRYCSATRAARTLCEGQSSCPPAGTEISGNKLCGYEPAPYADSSGIGLVVLYECIARTDDDWKTIGADAPDEDSLSNGKKSSRDEINLNAILRANAAGQIRCQLSKQP